MIGATTSYPFEAGKHRLCKDNQDVADFCLHHTLEISERMAVVLAADAGVLMPINKVAVVVDMDVYGSVWLLTKHDSSWHLIRGFVEAIMD